MIYERLVKTKEGYLATSPDNFVETYIDSTGGGDRTVWRSKYTASELRQLIARRLLRSLIDEFGQDLLTVIIEELQARPAAAQIVRDALGP